MTRTISRWLALLVVALSVSHAAAQSRTAEVRTWDGQTFQLAEPTLDVYYTIAPPPKDGNALPDVMDLLVVCVEAGMGFDAAVARVAEQPEGRGSPPHEDLLRMHLEMRAGRPREEAMKALT